MFVVSGLNPASAGPGNTVDPVPLLTDFHFHSTSVSV